MANKIAIYGGSFNPIHNAHLSLAQCAMAECGLDKVIFLPNAAPPHKSGEGLVEATHRYNMVQRAIKMYPCFEISDYEMNTFQKSYTIDTVRHMKKIYGAQISFIIGADSLYTLSTWKKYDELIHECHFIVADRNCKEGSDINLSVKRLRESGGSITLISMPKIDITSTGVRELIRKNKDISEFVPEVVKEYILENKLYKNNPED